MPTIPSDRTCSNCVALRGEMVERKPQMQQQIDALQERVYEIVCVNGLLILGESPLKHDGKSIECSLPISDGHGPLFGDIL